MKYILILAALILGLAHAQDVQVARSVGGVDDSGAYVIGEVRNASSKPVEYVKVVASFYDAAGSFIGSEYTYTERDTIGANEDGPFTLRASDIEDYDSYQLQVEAEFASSGPVTDLSIAPGQLQQGDYGWTLVGEVTNNSDQPMEYVKVVASAYVDDMRMAGTDYTFTQLDTLQPGQTSPFELSFGMILDQPNDYRVWVEGSPAR